MRRFLLRLALLGTLALTACGPVLPLNASIDQTGVDIFLGRPAPSPSPPPPALGTNPLPNFPAPLETAPFFNGPPPPYVDPCPTASPFAVPALPASETPTGAPAKARYPYRFAASEVSGGNTLALPGSGSREVKDVKTTADPAGTQHFSFTVDQVYNGETTSMSFDVQPLGAAGDTTAGIGGTTPAAGLYLTQMKDNSGNLFSPNPSIQIMPFPATQGAKYPGPGWEQGSGTDPLSATTMTLTTGLIKARERVNACGTLVDTWQVELTGSIGSAFGNGCPVGSKNCWQQKSFDLTFDCAPQYGAILVYDHLVEKGTDASNPNSPFQYDISATIDQLPVKP